MFSISLKIIVPTNQLKNLPETGLSFLKQIRRLEGCLTFKMFRDIEQPETLYFHSEWETAKIAERYTQNGLFKNLLKQLNLISFPLEISYQLVTKKATNVLNNANAHDKAAQLTEAKRIVFPNGFGEEFSKNTQHKYVSSNISEEQIQQYLEQITLHMEGEKPYLDKNLTLPKFAREIAIHPHHVSRVINEKLGLNFSNFVNSYRVKHSKQFLIEDFLSRFTISGIGNEAGFNSRSAFYNSFKKFAGMSPGDFAAKNQVLANLA